MVNDNFYVVTANLCDVIDHGVAILLSFHGPFDDGYAMEVAVEEKELSKSDLIQRVVIRDNEIYKLEEPFRPGIDERSDSLSGHPTTNGYYWVIIPDISATEPINVFVQGEHCYIHGRIEARKVADIVKYSPNSIPTFRP